ncbi:hypothetical protein [Burkholderia vietnamiensis]|uniref:hypothetical protein n=1 Tax=Burkholderia vietnamiensis TaxID=60552 RepID=UPI000AA4FE54|nr:hypothetical protein [Burkholderia vietnamiensis]HDR8931760.1 hypothetical protein [Burkholderia vietnamiensis]
MSIEEKGENLIKKNFFVEQEHFDAFVCLAKQKNQSVSELVRESMKVTYWHAVKTGRFEPEKRNYIERKIFVDEKDYELFTQYAKYRNQSISSIFRNLMKDVGIQMRKELEQEKQDKVCLSSPQPPSMGEVVEDKTSLSKNL